MAEQARIAWKLAHSTWAPPTSCLHCSCHLPDEAKGSGDLSIDRILIELARRELQEVTRTDA
jgi:hypothetical protein